MRSVRLNPTDQAVRTAGALLLVTLVSCSSDGGPSQITTVVFDGQTYTINGQVSCAMSHDGKLVINAADGRRKLIRVVVTRDHPLVVEAAGFRHLDVRGFTDNSNEVEATKVDNTYTISGRMPPEAGETARHQFKIEVACPHITEFTPEYGDQSRIPRAGARFYAP
jgi:Mycobacterium 19 kDa lipoprotein antigen